MKLVETALVDNTERDTTTDDTISVKHQVWDNSKTNTKICSCYPDLCDVINNQVQAWIDARAGATGTASTAMTVPIFQQDFFFWLGIYIKYSCI